MSNLPLILFTGSASPSQQLKPIIVQFPQKISHSRPFPYQTSFYIFPNQLQVHTEQQPIQTHFFNFANDNGRQFFGVSAVFTLNFDASELNKFADCSMFILLSEPLQIHFEKLLLFFAKRVRNITDLKINLEQMWTRIQTSNLTQLPIQIQYNYEESDDDGNLIIDNIYQKGQTPFQTKGQLLKKCNPETVTDVIEALLNERSVIITGTNLKSITLIIFDFLLLLYPFSWPYLLFSFLPTQFLPILHQPIPIFAGITLNNLQDAVLPQNLVIYNIDDMKIYEFTNFWQLKIYNIRTAIPRQTLDGLQSQFSCFGREEILQNTFNYDQSDLQIKPRNFAYQKAKEGKISIFEKFKKGGKKQEIVRVPTKNDIVCFQPIQHVKRLIPRYFDNNYIAFLLKLNVRSFDIQQFYMLHSQSNFGLNVGQSDAERRFSPFKKFPKLPQRVRNVMVMAISQNTVNPAIEKPVYDEIVPHPYSLLLEQQIFMREQVIFGQDMRSKKHDDLDQLVRNLTPFDVEKTSLSFITDQLSIQNSPCNVLLGLNKSVQLPETVSNNKRPHIAINKIKIGTCCGLLQLVKNYKKFLKVQNRKTYFQKPKEIQIKIKMNQVEIDPKNDYFDIDVANMFFNDILEDQQETPFSSNYEQIFDFNSFIIESDPDLYEFNSVFGKSLIFRQFLESRLSPSVIPCGPHFNSYSQGQFYAPKIAENLLSSNVSQSVQSFSLGRNSFNKDISQSTDESRAESPTQNSVVDEISSISYENQILEDIHDFADILIKHNIYQQYSHATSYTIYKLSVNDKWKERTLSIQTSQAQISCIWYEKKVQKGEIILSPDIPVYVDYQPDLPTDFPIQLFGTINGQKRILTICAKNLIEQRQILNLTRYNDFMCRNRLKLDSNACRLINLERKMRREALGNVSKELHKEGVGDQFMTGVYQCLDQI